MIHRTPFYGFPWHPWSAGNRFFAVLCYICMTSGTCPLSCLLLDCIEIFRTAYELKAVNELGSFFHDNSTIIIKKQGSTGFNTLVMGKKLAASPIWGCLYITSRFLSYWQSRNQGILLTIRLTSTGGLLPRCSPHDRIHRTGSVHCSGCRQCFQRSQTDSQVGG